MRILALDVGDKRIGVAISDQTGNIARALTTINQEEQNVLDKLRSLIQKYQIDNIIVGLPLKSDGTLGDQALKAQRFAESLKKETAVPILVWDERFTSVQAEKALLTMNLRRRKRKSVIDQVSASLILQSYLDHLKNEKSS